MGWSYVNLTLVGFDQESIGRQLENKHSVVSPTHNGFTLVAGREFDSNPEIQLALMGKQLSSNLRCYALGLSVFDDDILYYQVFESGITVDEYNSEPDYFDFAAKHVPPRGPQGGDAALLCKIASRPQSVELVEKALRESSPSLLASVRHSNLVKILGLPEFSVGFSYRSLEDGQFPEGLNEEDLIFT